MNEPDGKFPLLRYLDDLVDHLRRKIPAAIKGEEIDAVHDARVATRRLKAAIELLDSVISRRCRKPFSRITRRLRRQLGPLRDLDVMLEHLSEIPTGEFAAATDWLNQRLSDCRNEALARAQRETPAPRMLARLGSWWGLRQEISDSRDAVDYLLSESVHLQLDSFAEQADALGKGDPHTLRIAGKSLRYTLEMARAHGVAIPAQVTAAFKQIQDALGLWHDYVVLSERVLCEIVECDLALHDPKLAEEILSLSQSFLRQAREQLEKADTLWRPNSTELCEEIRRAFPLTKPVTIPPPIEPQIAPIDEPELDSKQSPAA